jgi:hypothetical protein
MMAVPAVIAAEFLIGAPIFYLISTVQAFRHMSDDLLCVSHPSLFFAKYAHKIPSGKQPDADFSFSLTRFFSFFNTKLFLNTLKKIFACFKKRNCFKKKKNIVLKRLKGIIYKK